MTVKKLLASLMVIGVVVSVLGFSGNLTMRKANLVLKSDNVNVVSTNPVVSRTTPTPLALTINSDSVGFAVYDYGSNGSSKRTVLNYGDGTVSQARTGSLQLDATYPDRGTYWAYYDGSAWTEDWLRIEDARVGWGQLGCFSNGKEVVVSHTGLRICTQNTAHTFDWTTRNTGTGALGGGTWPAMVVDGAGYVHAIHSATATFNGAAIRYDRYSAGGTVNDFQAVNLWEVTGADTLIDPREADGYDIHARGNKIAAVQASEGYGWMVVFVSNDNGATWTHTVIESFPATFPYEVAYIDPYIHIDAGGNVHVVWTTLTASDATTFSYSANNAVMHWSQATGRTEVLHIGELVDVTVFFNYNTPIAAGQNGGFLIAPSLAEDASGNLYCAVSAPHSVADTSFDGLNRGYYSHAFVMKSADGGATWSGAKDLNAGLTGWDVMYCNMAPSVGGPGDWAWALAAYVDPLPGNNVQNTSHQFQQNAVRVFHGTIPDLVGIGDGGNNRPVTTKLHNNYPNPFNPATTIAFDLSAPSNVELKVFNALGQEVATLVNGRRDAGSYTATFDAKTLSSGIYFYRLTVGNTVETKKMMLIK